MLYDICEFFSQSNEPLRPDLNYYKKCVHGTNLKKDFGFFLMEHIMLTAATRKN